MPATTARRIERLGYSPSLKPTLAEKNNFSEHQWTWHARHKVIYNRKSWVFIEEKSLFTFCFFDIRDRDLKNIDITFWFRFLNELHFLDQHCPEFTMPQHEPNLLSVIRSLMAPVTISVDTNRSIGHKASQVFSRIQKHIEQPLPCPLPIQKEIQFDWSLNSSNIFVPEATEVEGNIQPYQAFLNSLIKIAHHKPYDFKKRSSC